MSRTRYRPEEIIGKLREAFAAWLAALLSGSTSGTPLPLLSQQLAQEAGRGHFLTEAPPVLGPTSGRQHPLQRAVGVELAVVAVALQKVLMPSLLNHTAAAQDVGVIRVPNR